MLYCNDGDWVESLTALVEHHDGRLEIIDRSAELGLPVSAPESQAAPARGLAEAPTAAAAAAPLRAQAGSQAAST